jgi:hypothetical protein
MPWEVRKNGNQYCVHKKGASSPIKGGCHSTRTAAVKHMRALYSNVSDAAAAADPMTPYIGEEGVWRIDNVPIVSTGIEYDLSTGPHTFTEAELADAVAATEDSAIKDPRIKLGHKDKANAVDDEYLLTGDGEPAFGRVVNLKMGDHGQTLYGDYVGMPEWLAQIAPVAYPSRSVEAAFDVQTVTGKEYQMVLHAVSNLGVYWPGCSVLEDLPLWYGDETPDEAEIDYIDGEQVAAGGGMGLFSRKPDAAAEAAVDVAQIRRKFYNMAQATQDMYWYWIRGEKFDSKEGMYLIVDDEKNGNLYKVPVSVKENEIEFGDAIEVVEEFPEKAAASARAAVVAGMAVMDRGLVVHASRAETSPEDTTTQEGATSMDDVQRQQLAGTLGLPEDATEEQINSALQDRALADPPVVDETGSNPPPGESGEKPKEYPPVGSGPPDPNEPGTAEASGPKVNEDGTVTLDKGTYELLKRGADTALATAQDNQKRTINDTVEAAIGVGKIPPARRDHWRNALAADFEGNKKLLEEMPEGLVPVHMRGSTTDNGDEPNVGSQQAEGLPADWFPSVAAASSRRVTIAKEG